MLVGLHLVFSKGIQMAGDVPRQELGVDRAVVSFVGEEPGRSIGHALKRIKLIHSRRREWYGVFDAGLGSILWYDPERFLGVQIEFRPPSPAPAPIA